MKKKKRIREKKRRKRPRVSWLAADQVRETLHESDRKCPNDRW